LARSSTVCFCDRSPFTSTRNFTMDFCDVKVFGLWDSTSVDQGIGYNSVSAIWSSGRTFDWLMFLLKIYWTEPNPPPRTGTQFSFAMFTTKVASALCVIREWSPGIPGAAAIFAPKGLTLNRQSRLFQEKKVSGYAGELAASYLIRYSSTKYSMNSSATGR
jgi:hypothetical protein